MSPRSSMRSNNSIRLLFWLSFAAVVHLSLYPWVFRGWPSLDFPHVLAPIHPGDYMDCIANVFFYLPLGLFFFARPVPWWKRLAAAPLGFLLSYTLEILQRESVGRVSSGTDIYTNTLGMALGLLLAPVIGKILPRFRLGTLVSGSTLFLTTTFFLWQSYPFVAYLRFSKFRHILESAQRLFPSFNEAGDCLLAGAVLTMLWLSERGANLRNLFLVFGALLLSQIWRGSLGDQSFSTPATAALLLGFLWGLTLLRWGTFFPWAILLVAALAWICLRGIWPLEWRDTVSAFQWSPLSGVLDLPRNSYIRLLSGKLFLYGSAILIAIRSGIPAIIAGGAIVTLLFAIELTQRHIAGRTAETTDPVLALIAALILYSFEAKGAKPTARAPNSAARAR
jgi:glycopeptide antibiotics resistance protein